MTPKISGDLVPHRIVNSKGVLTTVHRKREKRSVTTPSLPRVAQQLSSIPESDSVPELNAPEFDYLFPLLSSQGDTPLILDDELTSFPDRAIYCAKCSRRLGDALTALFMEEFPRDVTCAGCGTVASNFARSGVYPIVGLHRASPTFVASDPEKVSSVLWYHWTHRPNWRDDILNESNGVERVHLGSERAAADRAVSYGSMTGYLYIVQVNDDVTVNPVIYDEQSNDFEVERGEEADVVRYTNMFEDVGSISLVVRPTSIRVLGVREVTDRQMNNIGTYFLSEDMEAKMLEKYPDLIV